MTAPPLAAREVTFTYKGANRPVFQDWSAEFASGSITAMTGSSGCGKSTRLYLLGLLLQPDKGSIELDGLRIDHRNDGAKSVLRSAHFGFVFQDAALDSSRSVIDNVLESCLYRSERRSSRVARAKALLDQFGLDIPHGRRPGEISGGQAQRIALCRALLADPPVILADEPTGNLDDGMSEIVLDCLRQAAHHGAAVVIVTHDERVAACADRRMNFGPVS